MERNSLHTANRKLAIVEGFERYCVDTNGDFWRNKNYLIKKLRLDSDKNGYSIVSFYVNGKCIRKKAHRIVALAFVPNPENKPEVNHKNGIRSDNNASNLEWLTHKENMQHSFLYLNRPRVLGLKGEQNPQSKLSGSQILDIRNTKGTLKNIATKYNVTTSLISQIKLRKSWKHI